MKHKVSELEGALLDAAVAKAEGRVFDLHAMKPHGEDFITVVDPDQSGWVMWSPSRLWVDGGPIIERERIMFSELPMHHGGPELLVAICGRTDAKGPTHLIAAMRAYVASKFGQEVEI